MRIVKNYSEFEVIDILEITDAKYVKDNSIEIYFSDGLVKIVDFKPFLLKSQHPSISKYLNIDLFHQFEIKNGNLNWNDYDLIFPIHDLYEGQLI